MQKNDAAYTFLKIMGYILSLVISFSFTGAIVPASIYLIGLLPQHLAFLIPAYSFFSVIIVCTFQQWLAFYSSQSDQSLEHWMNSNIHKKPEKKFRKYQAAIAKILKTDSDVKNSDIKNTQTKLEMIYLHHASALFQALAKTNLSNYYPAKVFHDRFQSLLTDYYQDPFYSTAENLTKGIFDDLTIPKKQKQEQLLIQIECVEGSQHSKSLSSIIKKIPFDTIFKDTSISTDQQELLKIDLQLRLIKELKKSTVPRRINYSILALVIILALFVCGPNTSFGGMALLDLILKPLHILISPSLQILFLSFFYCGGLANVFTYTWPHSRKWFSSATIGSKKTTSTLLKKLKSIKTKHQLLNDTNRPVLNKIEVLWVSFIYGQFSYMCSISLILSLNQFAPQWMLSKILLQHSTVIGLTSLALSMIFTLPTGRSIQKPLNYDGIQKKYPSTSLQVIVFLASIGNALTVFVPAILPDNIVFQALSMLPGPYTFILYIGYYLLATFSAVFVVSYTFTTFSDPLKSQETKPNVTPSRSVLEQMLSYLPKITANTANKL